MVTWVRRIGAFRIGLFFVFACVCSLLPTAQAGSSPSKPAPPTRVDLTATPVTLVPNGIPNSTLTARAAGGQGVFEYQFLVNAGDGWQVIRDWHTAPSFIWSPVPPGEYALCVYARERSLPNDTVYSVLGNTNPVPGNDDNAAPALTRITLNASPLAPQLVNTEITLSAKAYRATSATQYSFLCYDIYNGKSWKILRTWSPETRCVWTPQVASIYLLRVEAFDPAAPDVTVSAEMEYKVTAPAPMPAPTPVPTPEPAQEEPQGLSGKLALGDYVKGILYTVNADGTDWKQFSFDSTIRPYSTRFNDAGTKMVFNNKQPGPTYAHLFVMNPDGSGLKRITGTGGNRLRDNWDPCFSPDGAKIACISFGGGAGQVALMDADGGNATLLTSFGQQANRWVGAPFFFPDGRTIAFMRMDWNGRYSVMCVNTDGSGLKTISPNDGASYIVRDVTPDGKKLLCEYKGDLVLLNVDGNGMVDITDTPLDEFNATFNPDGTKIAFCYGPNWHSGKFMIMNADGSDRQELKPGTHNSPSARSWAP